VLQKPSLIVLNTQNNTDTLNFQISNYPARHYPLEMINLDHFFTIDLQKLYPSTCACDWFPFFLNPACSENRHIKFSIEKL